MERVLERFPDKDTGIRKVQLYQNNTEMATTYVCIICTPTVYTYVCMYMYNCIFTYVLMYVYVCVYEG